MHVGNKDHSRITARFAGHGDPLVGGLRGELLHEFCNRHSKPRLRHVGSHEAANRQIPHPADVLRAANGFAAQMQTPSREGIAEGPPHDNGHDARDSQHHEAKRKTARRLQSEKTHRHRRADDRNGKRRHPDEGADENVRRQRRIKILNAEEKRPANHAAYEKGRKEKTAAKAGPERNRRCGRLQ